MQIVADIGGLAQKSVTKQTRFLILGTQTKDGKSNKHLKAEKNLEKGQHIEIIPEVVFYYMLSADGYGQISMDEWVLRHNMA
jgi:DNA polymerase-3 subunit epsilon